jgi:hypothetical protein
LPAAAARFNCAHIKATQKFSSLEARRAIYFVFSYFFLFKVIYFSLVSTARLARNSTSDFARLISLYASLLLLVVVKHDGLYARVRGNI